MNARQAAFFEQARSDWAVFQFLRGNPGRFSVCHELHYLQMCAEKLAKAYYPAALRTHEAFRNFIRDLPSNPLALAPLGFLDQPALIRWQGSVIALVEAVENLAPAIADRKGLPNPEYPWPKGAERIAPASHSFQVEFFDLLHRQARSHEPGFLTIVGRMVATMRSDGWHL